MFGVDFVGVPPNVGGSTAVIKHNDILYTNQISNLSNINHCIDIIVTFYYSKTSILTYNQ